MMLIAYNSAYFQLVIVKSLTEDQVIILKLNIFNIMDFLQIRFTNTQQMWIMFSHNLFNLMHFIDQVSTPSIPVGKLDSPILSVPISGLY